MSVWHEIIVVGGERSLRGFLAGFVGGRALDEPILLGRDVAVESPTLTDRLRDLVGIGSSHELLAPAAVAVPLAEALRRNGADADLRFESTLEIVSAAFTFSAEAFAPDVAAKVEAALHGALPAGVKVERFEEQETTEGGARGTELSAPVHDYTYRANGRVTGDLPGVLEMHRRADLLEFVKAEAIVLETREAASPAD